MTHRSVIRLFSAVLLAVLVLGCDDESNPTDPGGPFLVVTPSFAGVDQGTTQQLTATLGGSVVPVTWASNNTAAATVSSTGLVTGVAGGFAAVTATLSSDPAQIRSASITVLTLQGIGLTSGVPVTGLSSNAGAGSTVLYRIFVPPGSTNLLVQMSGGSGDADLYVRRQTPPTVTTFDCRPFLGGNDETCPFPAPASGTWYIMIEEFDPYAGVTLTATVTP